MGTLKTLGLAWALVLVGCGGVVSDHPLSSEADSVLDERLIGWWEPAEPGDAPKAQQRLVVGRSKDGDRTLEVVTAGLDDEQRVKIERFRLFTVELDGPWYMSFTDEKAEEFLLIRYRIADDELTIELLDEQFAVRAIESGAIEGVVERNPKYAGPLSLEKEFSELRLKAPTAKLRAWIQAGGDGMWTPFDATFRRVPIAVPKREKK